MNDASNDEVNDSSDYSNNKDQQISMNEKDIEDLKEYICSLIDDYYKLMINFAQQALSYLELVREK